MSTGRWIALVALGLGSSAAVLALAWRVGRPLEGSVPAHALDARGVGRQPDGDPLAVQAALERQLAERVELMLGAVVGRGKALARVAVTLDLARVERTEESYDPDRTALRAERTRREQERRDETQSWKVSKVVSHTVAPAGAVKQLSVAVLVDGVYTGEGARRVFTPRPPEELAGLRELVKSAVGFSEARGDRIEVASVPIRSEPDAAGGGRGSLRAWLPAMLGGLFVAGLVFATFLWVAGPVVASVPAAGGERGVVLPEVAARLTQENLALAQRDPVRAAQLVREWLRESAPAIEG